MSKDSEGTREIPCVPWSKVASKDRSEDKLFNMSRVLRKEVDNLGKRKQRIRNHNTGIILYFILHTCLDILFPLLLPKVPFYYFCVFPS